MTFDCKSHCQRCIVCNRAKPDRRGGAALQPLGIPEYHGKLLVLITSRIFLKVAFMVCHLTKIVCHLTKMAHFDPCHKEIIAEKSTDLFFDRCYRLHGVPRVIVSDRDSKFVGKF
jgi:hypothetical protein